jgi:hypothetical protein
MTLCRVSLLNAQFVEPFSAFQGRHALNVVRRWIPRAQGSPFRAVGSGYTIRLRRHERSTEVERHSRMTIWQTSMRQGAMPTVETWI